MTSTGGFSTLHVPRLASAAVLAISWSWWLCANLAAADAPFRVHLAVWAITFGVVGTGGFAVDLVRGRYAGRRFHSVGLSGLRFVLHGFSRPRLANRGRGGDPRAK
jgi:hypothetical protein